MNARNPIRAMRSVAMGLLALLMPALLLSCTPAEEGSEPPGRAAEALAEDADREFFQFESSSFVVPAGEERFFCFAMTLEEDLSIDRYIFESLPVVHHLIVSETMVPEPNGFSECDVLFRSTWLPVFIAGTGDTVVDTPPGSGFELLSGTQLVLQLHLLNPTPEEVEGQVTVHFRKSDVEDLSPVGMVAFGNMNVALPPNAESQIVGHCEMDEEVEIFAVFPHMHYLGTSLSFEVGEDEDSMTQVFERNPYDFDDQRIESLEVSLKPNDDVRVTCNYDNTTDELVTFGESTLDEMCFMVGYVTGGDEHIGSCLGGSGPDASAFLPEGCGEDPPNSIGLGASCTAGGGECADGLICTHELLSATGPGLCIKIGGCTENPDCGDGGAVCCAPTIAGGTIQMCLPKSCLLAGCDPA